MSQEEEISINLKVEDSKKAVDNLQDFDNKLEQTTKAIQKVALSSVDLAKSSEKANNSIVDSTKENKNYSEALIKVGNTLAVVAAKVGAFSFREVSAQVDDAVTSFRNLSFGIAATATASTAAQMIIANNLLKSFSALDDEMRNVNAILKETPQGFNDLSDKVRDLSLNLKLATETEIAKGLYDVAGAGYEGAAGLTVMDVAIKASKAGRVEVKDSATLIAQTLNGMGKGAEFATETANILFKTVERGVISFQDLALGLGDITANAKTLEISLESVGAALALETRKGTTPQKAITNLNSLYMSLAAQSELAKKTAFDLGIAIDANAVKTKGFAKVISEMVAAAKGTGDLEGTLFKLLGRQEAMNAALQLSNADEFKAEMKAMENSSNSLTEALTEQSKALSVQFDELKIGLEAIKTESGELVGSIASSVIPTLKSAIDEFNSLHESTRTTIYWITGITLAIPAVITAFGACTLGIGLLIAQFMITKFVLGVITGLLKPLTTLLMQLALVLKNAAVAAYNFAAGTTAGSGALTALKASLTTAVAGFATYMAIVTAAAVAVGLLVKATLDLSKAQEQQRKDEQRNYDTQKDAVKKIAELRKKEAEGIKLTAKEQRDYAVALMSLGDSNKVLRDEAQRRAKLGREVQVQEKKEAAKAKPLTSEQQKNKQNFFDELSQEEINLSKNSFKKAQFEADKWRKEEQDKIKSNLAVNILTQEEAKKAELRIENIYNQKISQAREAYNKEIQDKKDKAEKEAREKREKAEREASESAEKAYKSLLSGLDRELNANETKANNGEISFKQKIDEENKILIQQRNIYRDLMTDNRILGDTKLKYAEKETELDLKVSQNKKDLQKKLISDQIEARKTQTENELDRLQTEHEQKKLLDSDFYNNQIFLFKKHNQELENIKKSTSKYGDERKNIESEIKATAAKIKELEDKKKQARKLEDDKFISDSVEEKTGRKKVEQIAFERSIEYIETQIKENENLYRLKKISEDEYFKNNQSFLNQLADKYERYSNKIVGDEVKKNDLIAKSNDARFQKELEQLERSEKAEEATINAKNSLYNSIFDSSLNIGNAFEKIDNSLFNIVGKGLQGLGNAASQYNSLQQSFNDTSQAFKKGEITKEAKNFIDTTNILNTVVNQISDSIDRFSESQTKFSFNTKAAEKALKDFGSSSKQFNQALQDINESISDNIASLPGVLNPVLGKLIRMIHDATGVTRSEIQKVIDSETERVRQNSRNVELETLAFQANAENATLETKINYAKKAYEHKVENLKKSDYTEAAYMAKSLLLSTEYFREINELHRKEIDIKLNKRKELNDLETDEIKKLKEATQIELEEIENSLDNEDMKYKKKLKLQQEFEKKSQELYEKTAKERENLIDKAVKKAIDGATRELNAQKIIFEKQSSFLKKTISTLEDQIDAIKAKYDKLREASPGDSKDEFNSLVSNLKSDPKRLGKLLYKAESRFIADQQLEKKMLDIAELKGEISHIDKLQRFKEMAAEANVYYSNIAEQLPRDSEKFYEFQEKTLDTFKDFSDYYNDYLNTKEKADTKPFEKKINDTNKDLKEVENKINDITIQIEEYKNKFEGIGADWKDSMNNAMFGTDGWITKFNQFIDTDLAAKIAAATNQVKSITSSLPVVVPASTNSSQTTTKSNDINSFKQANESIDDAIARIKREDAAAEKARLDALKPKAATPSTTWNTPTTLAAANPYTNLITNQKSNVNYVQPASNLVNTSNSNSYTVNIDNVNANDPNNINKMVNALMAGINSITKVKDQRYGY